ncbi:MAG TPA: MCP four helix bundle domain-containing protein, partial [Spirochaetota bacterium]
MKWFNNLSVLVKLLAGFIFVALLSAFVGFVGITNIRTVDNADKLLYEKAALPLEYMGQVIECYQKLRVYSRDLIRSNNRTFDGKLQLQYENNKAEIARLFKEYEKTFYDENDKREYETLVVALNDYYRLLDKIRIYAEADKNAEAYAYIDGDGVDVVRKVDDA